MDPDLGARRLGGLEATTSRPLRFEATELILRLGAYRLQPVLMESHSFSEGVLRRHCPSSFVNVCKELVHLLSVFACHGGKVRSPNVVDFWGRIACTSHEHFSCAAKATAGH